jgi:response regulator RpfG family c-di-GMP phosphodiesterase
VPDNILCKPDRLTENEFEVMKRHTLMIREITRATETDLIKDSFLKFADLMKNVKYLLNR